MSENQRALSEGERRVRIGAPGETETVRRIRKAAADLIDDIEEIDVPHSEGVSGEVGRMKERAKAAIEEGAMWAEKAATA